MAKDTLVGHLVLVVIMVFLVCAGAVGCCPWAAPLPAPVPGGPLPGEEVPGGPGPGGELQLVLMAQPDMVPPGGCTMLHWEGAPPGEYRVLLNGQGVPLVGEQQVCPPGTTTYELLVETPGGPQVRTVTVNVGGGPGGGPLPPTPGGGPGQLPTPGMGPPPTGGPGEGCAGAPTFTYFTASATSISAGQQVQLSWGEVRNGTSGPLVGSVVLSPGGFGEVGSPGSRWASPTTTTTYRLTATGCGGTATKDVTVTVGGAGAAATATPHPGGPTATKQAAGPTATKPAAGPTATPTTVVILVTVMPFVPAATPTPMAMIPGSTATPPGWYQCSWVGVEQAGMNSTSALTYCPSGRFLTGLDLDRSSKYEYGNMSPVVGQAECCSLAAGMADWYGCNWVYGFNSHEPQAWCADGSYLVGLDMGGWGRHDPYGSPWFTGARCCELSGLQYDTWSSCSWVGVENAGISSHAPETWCPNGTFMVGFDSDADEDRDNLDSPVVGQAYCCRP